MTKSHSGAAAVAGATITVHDRDDFTSPIVSATSAQDGTYSLVVPAGTPDRLFVTSTAVGFVDASYANLRPDLSQAAVTDYTLWLSTEVFLDAALALVDDTWDHATASIAGFAFDCDRRKLEHAAVTVSSTSGQRDFVPGVSVFYSAGDIPLPAPPDVRGDTSVNGGAAVVNVPADGPAYLQVWGFPDAAALSDGEAGLVLVAEYPLTRFSGKVLAFFAWANE